MRVSVGAGVCWVWVCALLTELENQRRNALAPESQDLIAEDSDSEDSDSNQDPILAAMLNIVSEASGSTDPSLL